MTNGTTVYEFSKPINWWLKQLSNPEVKVTLDWYVDFPLSDNSFDAAELFTPCEQEDRGSTKIFFYLLDLLNKYNNDFKLTNDERYMEQIMALMPMSYIVKGTIEVPKDLITNEGIDFFD